MSPAEISRMLKGCAVWAAVFAAGVLSGASFPDVFHAFVRAAVGALGSIAESLGAAPAAAALGIFAKNAVVAAALVLAGRPTRGVYPGIVFFLNGALVGTVGSLLCGGYGVSPWGFAAALAPHGSLELPALFLCATLGMAPLTFREKARAARLPAAMLAAAAVLETWVSPLVASMVLSAI